MLGDIVDNASAAVVRLVWHALLHRAIALHKHTQYAHKQSLGWDRHQVMLACIPSGLVLKKGSPHSITERRVPELIPVLGSQPAGDVSHKPGGRLPLLSARTTVTLTTLKRVATNFAAW